jgi:hypothetical protein
MFNFKESSFHGLLILVSSGCAKNAPPLPTVHSKPAPNPFDYSVEIKSDSYPLHQDQGFIIQSKERLCDWFISL